MVVPTTRVNLALPFSKITVEEPRRELAELAAIVADVTAALDAAGADPGLAELREPPTVRSTRACAPRCSCRRHSSWPPGCWLSW